MRPVTRDRDHLDPDPSWIRPGRGVAGPLLSALALALLPMVVVPVGARAADDSPPARMTVTGRVLDPSGKPVPDASVMVVVPSKLSDRPMINQLISPMTAHEGRCDVSGRFGIAMPRTTSARHNRLLVTARAPGYGIGWAEIGPDADPPATDITLRTEQVIRGRLFDVQGRPARGVALAGRWRSCSPIVSRGLVEQGSLPARPYAERPRRDLPCLARATAISDRDARPISPSAGWAGASTSVLSRSTTRASSIAERHAPGSTTTPTPGTFGFPLAVIKVEPGPDPKPIAIALEPARIITGRVTCADTGRPVPHALIAFGVLRYQADDQGRFRVAAPAVGARLGRFNLRAQSPDGSPYLIASKQGEWPRGVGPSMVGSDLALTRGVVVRVAR